MNKYFQRFHTFTQNQINKHLYINNIPKNEITITNPTQPYNINYRNKENEFTSRIDNTYFKLHTNKEQNLKA